MSDIENLVILPAFVKTAVICLIRRICRREQEELKTLGHMTDKPLRVRYPHLARRTLAESYDSEDPPDSTFIGPDGFTFLQPILEFLMRPIHEQKKVGANTKTLNSNSKSLQGFTDIELEILKYLPDVCTHSTRPIDPATSYRDWLAFASRHSVLLLTRSQYCPALTRAQVTTQKEEIYNKLIYDTIIQLYAKSMSIVDEEQALGLIISSLSTNLGIILAQLSDESRLAYFDASTKIINASMSLKIKNISQMMYGQIGHA